MSFSSTSSISSANLKIREDGVLTINYIDKTEYIIMPDGTTILKKVVEGTTTTFITKEGYVPIRQTFDKVKARGKTCIGLGGTDALMGKDNMNKAFAHTWCFMPSNSRWAYSWFFQDGIV